MPTPTNGLANLRALALGRGSRLHPLPLVLDDEIRNNMLDAQNALATLLQARQKMTESGDLPPQKPESLADEPAPATTDIDRMIAATRETIEQIQQQAIEEGKVVVVQFRSLSPDAYRVVCDKQERLARKSAKDDDGPSFNRTFHTGLRDELLEACYVGTFAPGPQSDLSGGEDLDISLEQLRTDVLTDGDMVPEPSSGPVLGHLLRVNRGVAAVPFLPPSSGRPATS